MLCVHGRTKEEKKDKIGNNNFEMIRKIKAALDIPVISNGEIADLDDVNKALEVTKCDGVMVSEAILEDVTIFNPEVKFDPVAIAKEFIEFNRKYSCPMAKQVLKPHLFKMLYQPLMTFIEIRNHLGRCDHDKVSWMQTQQTD